MTEEAQSTMDSPIELGARKVIDGQERVYYDGYWVKTYPVPADTLEAKKELIAALTRRLFNHTEHGLNMPGTRLDEARRTYEEETDPVRRRIKGGMLAGALFNRATGIFTQLVEIQRLGVEIQSNNPLMRMCGEHLKEALELGKLVRHRSGEEGIDELWGEPFKAFALPVESFYESRYIKIAQTMQDIDSIAETLTATFADLPPFLGIGKCFAELAESAKGENRDAAHRQGHFRGLDDVCRLRRTACRVRAEARSRLIRARAAGGRRCLAAHPDRNGTCQSHHACPGADAQEQA